MLELERRPTRRRIYMQVKPETKDWIEEQMAKAGTKVSYGLVIDTLVDQARLEEKYCAEANELVDAVLAIRPDLGA